ncbi:MAG: ATP-binding protein [Candidatus Bathyarchaeia archaeon]|jgi:PAS domain S-box-containing protein
MEIYALLNMCACVICIGLGLGVYFLNRKAIVNQLFAFVMLTNAYWALCEFMLVRAPTLEAAMLWNKILSFWPLIVAAALHFTLAFTENSVLKRKFAYLLIYLPALFFSFIDLTTDWISSAPVLKPWGYIASYPSYSLLSSLDGIWAASTTLATILLYSQYYFRLTDKTKKEQTRFVAVGFAFPIILSILTDSLFPVIGIDFPVMGNIAVSFTAFIVAYAVVKHELFGLNVEIAAENVFSTMPDSVILVSLEGKIVKVNRALVELTGYKEEEVVGRTVNELLTRADVLNMNEITPRIIAQMLKQQGQKEGKDYEISFYTKFGVKKFGSLSYSLVTNNQGQKAGIAFVLHDITEQKELSKKLIETQRLASIGELAGIIGHDLRNPLTGIKGAAYYLKTKYSSMLDSKDVVMFETIDKSIDYSNKIVKDLIDYSTDIRLELETTTPQKLVQTAIGYIPPPVNIQVVDVVDQTIPFKVDAPKICRSFINIIKNAYDAMPNGGTLTISTKRVYRKIVFNFTDTGQGMTPEVLDKIWSPLFTTKAKGMGFGLAISKRSVEAHGGKISAESQHKKGTTIKVELPLDLDSTEQTFEKPLGPRLN